MPLRRAVDVTPGFCILWALLLLVLPLRILAAGVMAALVHELAHWAAIRLLGGQVLGLTLGAGGMVMETPPMEPGRELVCALAGPLGSALAVMLYPRFPLLALCALVQGCFNLLPLYPLDGGRAVHCLLAMLGRGGWMKWIEMGALAALLALAAGLRMGIAPILVWGMVALRKIPCKARQFGVE